MQDLISHEIYWYPPGGRIEQDETPVETVKREVLEETGYDIQLITENHIITEYGSKWCNEIYWCMNYTFLGKLLIPKSDVLDRRKNVFTN
jgi:8-oxo-dGTP pyrophosphatase MutT (NUDIX family)